MLEIRKALLGDIQQITDIYNKAIINSNATFDIVERTVEEQKKWFENHGNKNPIIVAVLNGKIVGWAALSRYDKKRAYSDTAEISMYIKSEFQRQGIGKKLIDDLIKEGEKVGLHSIIARITEGNDVSIKLHRSVGFEIIGIMKEVGYKFGERLDVCLMQKLYK